MEATKLSNSGKVEDGGVDRAGSANEIREGWDRRAAAERRRWRWQLDKGFLRAVWGAKSGTVQL